jgi:thymidylate kinase
MCELIDMPNTVERRIDPRRQMLAGIFRALNESGVAWCIAHGYEQFADETPTDIDCIVGRELTPKRLAELLHGREGELHARIVQWLSDGAQWIVLASNESPPTMLQLHVSYDYELSNRVFYPGEEILQTRQPHEDFWIASPTMEFGCVLVNRISKAKLDECRQNKLAALFEEDPSGCARQIERFFNLDHVRLLTNAMKKRDWNEVGGNLDPLRGDLLNNAKKSDRLAAWFRRIKRWLKPDTGLHVVFLGPDGVGKSTVIEGVKKNLSDAFLRTDYFTFAPSLIPSKLQPEKKTPHALPPRSYPASLLKAAWWVVCYTVGYQLTVRPAKARGSFVMNHRYLLDAMVDPKRYRYSGPAWLLGLIWTISPKPDLVALLDAEPRVIWERKKEVALEEAIRQRDAYRKLIEPMRIGRIVDASQPVEQVVADVDRIVLDVLAGRVARKFGLENR